MNIPKFFEERVKTILKKSLSSQFSGLPVFTFHTSPEFGSLDGSKTRYISINALPETCTRYPFPKYQSLIHVKVSFPADYPEAELLVSNANAEISSVLNSIIADNTVLSLTDAIKVYKAEKTESENDIDWDESTRAEQHTITVNFLQLEAANTGE